MRVYKYELPLAGKVKVKMPGFIAPLSAQNQHGRLILWALVVPGAAEHDHEFNVVLTGHDEVDSSWVYLDTVQFDQGSYVVHVFFRRKF